MEIQWRDIYDTDFASLITELDAYCRSVTGLCQAAFSPHNTVAALSDVAVLLADGQAVGCGALKPHDDGTVELKRVFVKPQYRRHGYAQALLDALTERARAQGFHTLLLETNPGFAGAVALYQRNGFAKVPAFGPYTSMCTLCLGKSLR